MDYPPTNFDEGAALAPFFVERRAVPREPVVVPVTFNPFGWSPAQLARLNDQRAALALRDVAA